jgi:WD40 repeat protein
VDLYGDPLPPGAIVRLGSVRFRHPGSVHEVAFSPDGKLLAASSDGVNMVILWERATGRKIREIFLGARPGQQPQLLRFSADGKRLFGCSWYGLDMKLYAWDVATGMDAREVPPLPAGMRTLGYSPDGREMILLHHDEVVRWDIDKGEELGSYPSPRNVYLSTAVDKRLLVPHFDGKAVGMWDVVKDKRLWSVKTTRDEHGSGPAMTFSADGKLFAVEAPRKEIAVYESVTGKIVRRIKGDAGRSYHSLSLSPDARIVAGSHGETVCLWDLESGRERLKVRVLPNGLAGVFFAPDSKVFATGGPNNPHVVQLWDTATGKQIDAFPGHTDPVASVAFSPDGRMAATSAWFRGDPVVRVWDARTGRLLRSLDLLDAGGVTMVAFSPDGETLAASHWKHWKDETKVRIWNARTGRELHALTGHARNRSCICVVFSPDGKRVASGDNYYSPKGEEGGRLCLWDAKAGKLIREIRGTRGSIQRLLFTPDGRYILAAANGVHIYDADTGELVGKPFQAKTRVWRLGLSADGRLLATSDGHGGPVRLWELATRCEISLAPLNVKGEGVALTPDGRTVAGRDPQGNVYLFHWPSGKTVAKLSGDIGTEVFFSPDGRRLATAENYESTALIWDVASLVNPPLPAVAKPSEVELRRWWADLSDNDPGTGYKAVWRFAAVPEQALPFLAASLRSIKPTEPATITRLIDELDSDEFSVREKASRDLRRLGELVEDHLRQKRRGAISAEQTRRIDELLADIYKSRPGAESLLTTRAVAILEQIGGAEARKILTGLATGAPGARLTQEAQGALERLKRAER